MSAHEIRMLVDLAKTSLIGNPAWSDPANFSKLLSTAKRPEVMRFGTMPKPIVTPLFQTTPETCLKARCEPF
jgi:hypothetical protein